jgi:hypothetical protein
MSMSALGGKADIPIMAQSDPSEADASFHLTSLPPDVLLTPSSTALEASPSAGEPYISRRTAGYPGVTANAVNHHPQVFRKVTGEK